MKVAVLGLGIMGQGVARTLLRGGFDVTVWNRSPEKASPFADEGATVAGTVAEAVAGADVILSIVFDAASVLQVLSDAQDSVGAESVWVQASTIGLDGTARAVKQAADAGIPFVEAMMLGTKTPAETGKLVMLAAGDPALVEKAQPVLDAIGQKTVNAGSRVGNGTALKLASNAWIASITAATAQSLAIAQALGLDASLFLEAIDGGASDSPYAHLKGGAMLTSSFDPSFALDGLRKDIGLITDAATGAGVDTRLLAALGAVYGDASDSGHGADDVSAVFSAFTPREK